MTGIAKTLSESELNIALQQAEAISQAATDIGASGKFVFFSAFDGTNNSEDFAFSGDKQVTAVHEVLTKIRQAARLAGNRNIAAEYYVGVGTPPTEDLSAAMPTSQIIKTAKKAYDEFAVAASVWRRENPDGEITSAIMSFSRGGGSAAVFSQMLYANGLIGPDGEILIEPGATGAVSAALILDPVLTGIEGNMTFPTTVNNLAVVRADDEHRPSHRCG